MPHVDAFSWNLILATAGVAITHTLFGPDHYLPFIMLARARHWPCSSTVLITTLCGLGHILSSLFLELSDSPRVVLLRTLRSWRECAAIGRPGGLFGFGMAYLVWGVRKAIRTHSGIAAHAHGIGVHIHTHGDHVHAHPASSPAGSSDASSRSVVTFWSLFIVFVLGPCEPLIPLFVLPASRGRWDLALLTGVLFGLLTIVLMVAVTLFALAGLTHLNFGRLERWSHAMAGAVIALSGAAILFLGL